MLPVCTVTLMDHQDHRLTFDTMSPAGLRAAAAERRIAQKAAAPRKPADEASRKPADEASRKPADEAPVAKVKTPPMVLTRVGGILEPVANAALARAAAPRRGSAAAAKAAVEAAAAKAATLLA